ncbi:MULTISPECIES: aminoglycoside phosphotransferase family protein [Hyphomicrobiales]|uniref:Aminoglycoside phosphotransferase n=1 Tax=Bradyrhizobium lupini HPC(L) TaxID=1229491 RepID=A0ABP2RVH5_RHILU|nr:aminoglycoside phosphotransferase family protein [Agrobacterium pusense]EKJ96737.1 aminoglycoside phosphotransferase [Bradyrhizobium lupini HPC(L)]NTE44239.1 aminoglycoside phosphotransferase family protein [Agrobacterium pusense]
MDDRIVVSEEQVRALIACQFPDWAELDVRPVDHAGWSNRSFRLGDAMLVRLPSAERYVAQVEKEHRWLPFFASHLPMPVPVPLACGKPGADYPWPWSVYGWLEGEPLINHLASVDLCDVAADVASFLNALHALDTSDGPPAGVHNFHRGGSLHVYDEEARASMRALTGEVDAELAMEIWQCALSSRWHLPPVWVHGDVSDGNLLFHDGRLSAVIDFGSCCIGDPSSDLVLSWNLFTGESRTAFRAAVPMDKATWQRGRGWALWKALITLEAQRGKDEVRAEWSRRTIREVFADHIESRNA